MKKRNRHPRTLGGLTRCVVLLGVRENRTLLRLPGKSGPYDFPALEVEGPIGTFGHRHEFPFFHINGFRNSAFFLAPRSRFDRNPLDFFAAALHLEPTMANDLLCFFVQLRPVPSNLRVVVAEVLTRGRDALRGTTTATARAGCAE